MKSLEELKKELDVLTSLDDACSKLGVDARFGREMTSAIRTKLVDAIKEKLKEINNELK